MLSKTELIVFRTIKYSDTSLIIKGLCPENGLQSYIVSGVRKPKSKLSQNYFQALSHLEIVAYVKPNRDLNRIKEVRPVQDTSAITFDPKKSAVAIFCSEILSHIIKTEEKDPLFFNYLVTFIERLTKSSQINLMPHHFMINTIISMGFEPDFRKLEGNMQEAFSLFNKADLSLNRDSEDYLANHVSYDKRMKLLITLVNFLQEQLDEQKEIKSIAILRKIFHD